MKASAMPMMSRRPRCSQASYWLDGAAPGTRPCWGTIDMTACDAVFRADIHASTLRPEPWRRGEATAKSRIGLHPRSCINFIRWIP